MRAAKSVPPHDDCHHGELDNEAVGDGDGPVG